MSNIENKDEYKEKSGIQGAKFEAEGVEINETAENKLGIGDAATIEMDSSENDQKKIIKEGIVEKERNTADTASVVQSVGHLLRNARISRSMSLSDVARQLRLSVQQVEAIEKEDYDKLPGRTFMRGFVRNYANLLQLDPVAILQLLPQSAPTISVQRTPFRIKEISLTSNHERNGHSLFIIIIILILFSLVIYWIYQNGDWSKESVVKNSTETTFTLEPKVKTDPETIELSLPLPPPVSSFDILNNKQLNQTAKSVELENNRLSPEKSLSTAELANATPKDHTIGILHFLFSKESWVNVKDNRGKTIFEQTNASGTERVISGKRPLSLVIGNAAGVNLTYNDRPIDLKPYTRKNEGIARLALE
ncbi:cytoskeleton protein RodZ [Nitrosomonas cryotolerans]|uniref:Cytoskeleton protein RodZ n=1 Tax=Nitrosomonas cryotolerans ATCC 49181 TaxID=1131553 RepID=A0A1N6ITD7_9PROT|nr:helix-turn-helix domain-containing protein [Nitrosomonas cryotolerans]SFP32822.1 cytoskeleton protein RodZ [Nitrosomonas cryotolerans]SIO35279.1 cytoskeleton protein RodZ [Nitrosomonas cryotolerans ATCC 49181]